MASATKRALELREKSPSDKFSAWDQTARRSSNVKKRVKQILSIVLGRRRPGFLPRTLARARVNNVTHVAWTELRRSGAPRVPLAPAVALRFPATSVATLFYRCARGFREAGGFRRSGPRARGRSPGRERSPARDRAMPRVTIVARAWSRSRSIPPARLDPRDRAPPPATPSRGVERSVDGERGGPVRARTRAAAAPRPPIADDRARRPTDPRGYRRAGTVGRRARAAVTRAPPLASHPQPRSETIAPTQPAIHHRPLLPSLTSPRTKTLNPQISTGAPNPARDHSHARAHTHDGLRRTRAARATR